MSVIPFKTYINWYCLVRDSWDICFPDYVTYSRNKLFASRMLEGETKTRTHAHKPSRVRRSTSPSDRSSQWWLDMCSLRVILTIHHDWTSKSSARFVVSTLSCALAWFEIHFIAESDWFSFYKLRCFKRKTGPVFRGEENNWDTFFAEHTSSLSAMMLFTPSSSKNN